MTIKEAYQTCVSQLSKLYGETESYNVIDILFEYIFNFNKAERIINNNTEIDDINQKKISEAMNKLLAYQPIQYVTGRAFFWKYYFYVNENVLIPRPETEELVKHIINNVRNTKNHEDNLKILDIGTGSGCIAISLKKELPNSEVYAIDSSEHAINVAKHNANKLGVEINFFNADIFSNHRLFENNSFDIIVSNPPYVTESEKQLMNKNVLLYEPKNAIFVSNEQPIIFYKRIADLSNKLLKPNGHIWLEINPLYSEETEEYFKKNVNNNLSIYLDFNKKKRILHVINKNN
ncbi:MAG: peptide chain release factor N(5)-glutamine methyltransferase [Lentimicrobiaceae bacterium]|nr:peptide chain release factor N(5)-glutamine methyltransferase [Lentimicrobiaceae bacterium]